MKMSTKTKPISLGFVALATLVLGGAISPIDSYAAEVGHDYCTNMTGDYAVACQQAVAAMAAIDQNKLPDALQLAVDAVDQQIPKFKDLKEAPYGGMLVRSGWACGAAEAPANNPWNIACGPWNAKMVLAAALAGVGTGAGLDAVQSNPNYTAMMEKTFAELIALGKADAKYTTDAKFAATVNYAEQNYNTGTSILRTALLRVSPSTPNLNTMTGEELLVAVEALPEYKTYGLDSDGLMQSAPAGLYSSYNLAMGVLRASKSGNFVDDLDDGYKQTIGAYRILFSAAKAVDPNFTVDLSSLETVEEEKAVPALPNTGSTSDGELSATVITVALAGLAGLTSLAGLIYTVKRYLFSPLKRRK